MPGFTPHCPRCGAAEVKQVARNDRYPLEGRRPDTAPISTTFAYRCQCGVAFTFEIKHASDGQALELERPPKDYLP